MRAWIVETIGPVSGTPLRLVDLPDPVPADDEVLVRVSACGICRTDLHVVEGDLELRRPHVTPGHQVVGIVEACGSGATALRPGDRVGVAWLHRTCGTCRFCRTARENLCERPDFTGWTVPGGFAELITAPAAFCYRLPDGFDDLQAAPLLCAGIIGYRSLSSALDGLPPALPGEPRRLGIYGFGAAGHVVLQLARARDLEVHVCTRDRDRHQALARRLGAAWVGGSQDPPPAPLHAAIVFAPAGELVPVALAALDRGGRLVLGGIHMSTIPALPYSLLYQERSVCSVANNTRADGHAFLAEAARIGLRPSVQAFPFAKADQALRNLRADAIAGAGVVVMPDHGRA